MTPARLMADPAGSSDASELVPLLVEIRDALHELIDLHRAGAAPRGHDDNRDKSGRRVVDALNAYYRDEGFTTTGAVDDARDRDVELRAAIEKATGKLGPGTAKKLGHLLARESRRGSQAKGPRVQRLKKSSVGRLWSVHCSSK